MTTPLEDKLTPKHLLDLATDEQRKKVDEDAETAKKREEAQRKEAMRQREYTFRFRWPKEEDKPVRYAGIFTSKMISIKERQRIGVLRAQYAMGIPPEALDPMTHQLNLMLATLAFALDMTRPDFPDWAKDLGALDDPNIVTAIYEEVLAHELTFLGHR